MDSFLKLLLVMYAVMLAVHVAASWLSVGAGA